MEIIISERIWLKGAPQVIINNLIDVLRIPNPKYSEAVMSGRSVYGINPFIINFTILSDDSILIPKGMLSYTIKKCDDYNIGYDLIDNRMLHDFIDIDSSGIKFKDYQLDAVSKLSGYTNAVLVSPAGSGKTVMGMSMISTVGQPTLWLTHTTPLARQAKERAEKFLPGVGKVGLLGSGKWEVGEVLTIGIIQTLVRRLDTLGSLRNEFGMVIVDEGHHVPSRTFMDVITHFNNYYTYGLTATPNRRDGLQNLMYQAIGTDTVVIPNNVVADSGGVIMPAVRCREIKSETVDGNELQPILKKFIINNDYRNNIIVDDVINEAKSGHFCIVISDRRDHCEILFKKIKRIWDKTGIATGKYSKAYVAEQVDNYNNGDITVLVATSSLLGEGFDVPFLDRAFITMPFRSNTKTTQIIGRIQRTHPSKKDALVYDYLDVNIGVVMSQFSSRTRECRLSTYSSLGVVVLD